MRIEQILTRLTYTDGRVYNEWCDEEETIMRMVFEGTWSWMLCFWALLNAGIKQHKTDDFRGMIYDLSASDEIPDGVWLVGKFDWIWDARYWPENMTRIVVIGGGPQMDEIFEVRQKVAPPSMRFFRRADTLAQAIDMIQHWDA